MPSLLLDSTSIHIQLSWSNCYGCNDRGRHCQGRNSHLCTQQRGKCTTISFSLPILLRVLIRTLTNIQSALDHWKPIKCHRSIGTTVCLSITFLRIYKMCLFDLFAAGILKHLSIIYFFSFNSERVAQICIIWLDE